MTKLIENHSAGLRGAPSRQDVQQEA